jgi:sugar lactone lactonase YvrE
VRRAAAVTAALAALLACAAVAGAQQPRPRWDTRVLALVPPPGFPAHAYVHPNGRIYEGTYVNLLGDSRPSRVFEYDGAGTLLRSWTMTGQDLAGDTGVQVATSDARGRLVLLDHSPARALLLDTRTGELVPYATFPLVGGEPPIPNYATWGPDGSLYVTDYGHGVIFRVPPAGGIAEPWLADPRLDAVEFGTTGIALAADRRTLLVGQQTSPAAGNPLTGGIFTVAIGADGRPGALRRMWESGPLDLADGFAVARSGRVYVAALGPNQVVVLGPDGREQERFPEQLIAGDNGSPVPFDTPSSAAFEGTRLVVPNQAQPLGNADHQVLHDVEVGEEGLPELIPANAGLRPGERAAKAKSKSKKKSKKKKKRSRHGRP